MPEITGVTFPVPKHLMPRFIEENKTVFIKPATVFKDLRSNMKLVFYQSTRRPATSGKQRSSGAS